VELVVLEFTASLVGLDVLPLTFGDAVALLAGVGELPLTTGEVSVEVAFSALLSLAELSVGAELVAAISAGPLAGRNAR
jgi:hypothetical protein